MKRSNLMLLVLLAVSVTLIAGIPILHRAQLPGKKKFLAPNFVKQKYGMAKVIKVINARQITVLPSDTLMVEYEPNPKNKYMFDIAGDTLVVRTDGPLFLHAPNVPIIAFNSNLLVTGILPIGDMPSLSFVLHNSRLYSQHISRDTHVPQQLDTLSITDKENSIVELAGRFSVLHLRLENVGQLSCTNDVGFRETDFIFREGRNVKALTCPEGMNIYSE